MKYFVPDYFPWADQFAININEKVYEKIGKTTGSFNVLLARILGLSYADSLRYFRDHYNAKIMGKEGYYCIVRFDKEEDCRAACDLLSARWEQLLRRL